VQELSIRPGEICGRCRAPRLGRLRAEAAQLSRLLRCRASLAEQDEPGLVEGMPGGSAP